MALPDGAISGGARPPIPRRGRPSVLVIGCGALARELLDVVTRNGLQNIEVECLPAILHNRPEKIPAAVRARLDAATGHDQVFVAYGDCGTGGKLDEVLDEYGVERLPGAHCYQFYAGMTEFDQMHEDEPGTLYLTDYLARHFDRLIWQGLGLDRWPELLEDYFGNYSRVVYLAQTNEGRLTDLARDAATRLGLQFERRFVGYGELKRELVRIAAPSVASGDTSPVSPPSGGSPGSAGEGGEPPPALRATSRIVASLLGEETVAPLLGEETGGLPPAWEETA